MGYHVEAELALLARLEANGGTLTVFFRQGRPRLTRAEARALARLVRSGHIRRLRSGDFGWVQYGLKRGEDAGQ